MKFPTTGPASPMCASQVIAAVRQTSEAMNSRWISSLAFVAAVSLLTGPRCWAGHTPTAEQGAVLEQWLREHPGHRRATLEDCRCLPDVESLRRQQRDHWGVAPDYHPYLVVGDLNSDAEADLAVVVVDPLGEWMFLIFNGPLEVGATPSFVDTGLDFERKGLFPPCQQ